MNRGGAVARRSRRTPARRHGGRRRYAERLQREFPASEEARLLAQSQRLMVDSKSRQSPPPDAGRPSPGARLRAARERKGLTLPEAADALRLDHTLLEAIERDDFAALGAPVFAKGHLRKYAALVGEPADDILLAYHQHVGVQEVLPLVSQPPCGAPVSSPAARPSPRSSACCSSSARPGSGGGTSSRSSIPRRSASSPRRTAPLRRRHRARA